MRSAVEDGHVAKPDEPVVTDGKQEQRSIEADVNSGPGHRFEDRPTVVEDIPPSDAPPTIGDVGSKAIHEVADHAAVEEEPLARLNSAGEALADAETTIKRPDGPLPAVPAAPTLQGVTSVPVTRPAGPDDMPPLPTPPGDRSTGDNGSTVTGDADRQAGPGAGADSRPPAAAATHISVGQTEGDSAAADKAPPPPPLDAPAMTTEQPPTPPADGGEEAGSGEGAMETAPPPQDGADMPSFDEWKLKMLAVRQQEKIKQLDGGVVAGGGVGPSSGTPLKTTHSRLNYAGAACGAKVVTANSEATNPAFILSENRDQYIISPCRAKKWIVVELCEPVQIETLELGNLELFSSQPESFVVQISGRFPTKEWKILGTFHARDERTIQSFSVGAELYAKYLRVEMLTHYGSEHYCPLTVLRVYGSTMMEDDVDDYAFSSDHATSSDTELTSEEELDLPTSNLFTNAKDTVLSLVKTVLSPSEKTYADDDAPETVAAQTDVGKLDDATANASSVNTSGNIHDNGQTDDTPICRQQLTDGDGHNFSSLRDYVLSHCDFCERRPLVACRLKMRSLCSYYRTLCRVHPTSCHDARPVAPPSGQSTVLLPATPVVSPVVVQSDRTSDEMITPSSTVTDASRLNDSANDERGTSLDEEEETVDPTPLWTEREASGKAPAQPDVPDFVVVETNTAYSRGTAAGVAVSMGRVEEREEGEEGEKGEEDGGAGEEGGAASPAPQGEDRQEPGVAETTFVLVEERKADGVGQRVGDEEREAESRQKGDQQARQPQHRQQHGPQQKAQEQEARRQQKEEPAKQEEQRVVDHRQSEPSPPPPPPPPPAEKPAVAAAAGSKDIYAELSPGARAQEADADHDGGGQASDEPDLQRYAGAKKETTYVRLRSRIKSLELNLNLSSRYLEELSQRYKKYMEDMYQSLNRTINKLANTTRSAEKRDLAQQDNIAVLQRQVDSLTTTVISLTDSTKLIQRQVVERHLVLIAIELLIFTVVLVLCVVWRPLLASPVAQSPIAVAATTPDAAAKGTAGSTRPLHQRSSSLDVTPSRQRRTARPPTGQLSQDDILLNTGSPLIIAPNIPLFINHDKENDTRTTKRRRKKGGATCQRLLAWQLPSQLVGHRLPSQLVGHRLPSQLVGHRLPSQLVGHRLPAGGVAETAAEAAATRSSLSSLSVSSSVSSVSSDGSEPLAKRLAPNGHLAAPPGPKAANGCAYSTTSRICNAVRLDSRHASAATVT